MTRPEVAEVTNVNGNVTLPPQQSTIDLVARARGGDAGAYDVLFRRTLPGLKRWARGRLPARARELCDTEDLVQDTVFHTLRRIDAFQVRHPGALLAYLRQALMNRICDEVRRANRRPAVVELEDNQADGGASPLEEVIGRQNVDRYEAALQRLRPHDREAIVARLEQQCSYEDLAALLNKPSSNAARVAVKRALMRLAEEMKNHG